MNETSDSKSVGFPAEDAKPADATGGDVERSSSTRARPYRFLGITVLALLGLLAMAGVKSYRDLVAAQEMENELRRQIAETKARVQALDEHIERVENDPATLERIAREELGMVHDGDVVIVLPEESTETDAAERLRSN